MDKRKYIGLVKATPQKRYKSFVTTICDRDEVWLYVSMEGNVSVWPQKSFGEALYNTDELQCIDVHEFINYLLHKQMDAIINVFPTTENNHPVRTDELLCYIREELDRIE
ncbi:MAG: hypothetical protein IJM56_03040 [Clostridia bacterium]|nr:hypothetical protein [Clostridia bacterium]MBQ9408413.1 hypothetical protein [Clostridia bacterium]